MVWNDLSNDDPVLANDNPASVITPQKVDTFKHQYVRQINAQAWSSAMLTAELAGSDPMMRIVSRVSDYWARYFNRLAISTITGVINDNIANDGGDMVYSAGVGVGGATPSAAISATAILEAKQTLGDAAEQLSIIIMHSRLYTNLQSANLITFIPNSRGEINIPTYLGYRVVVADTMPATSSGGHVYYTSYLCAPGVLGWGESPVAEPVATEKYQAQGNGMGVEALFTRRQFALHPYGFSWTDSSIATTFPTRTEIETAANWDRKYPERKQIKFAALLTKNG